ncbi:AAA family ATPase [Spirulina sp. CS-785/01]|uniref:AAA family ATPase n=1 Tax=Spirulina sp. CS-785/01 TaxID=3021716 RepID=UPI00232EE08F|nr:AAA family ATPase [Spirulina sp. CS-785/01]MDB9315393.1 AAA family ATPase [Spirulina sp. CS-785/01]
MIKEIELHNFGPIQQLKCNQLGQINLIIGGNGRGKTILLKALYTAVRTLEEYQRGNEPRTAAEILAAKLYWTFETETIGDLVQKGANDPLSLTLCLNEQKFSYQFGEHTTKSIQDLQNKVSPRTSNSIYIPPKEVISLHGLILQSREQQKIFGFDDTYLDLVRALRHIPKQKKSSHPFSKSIDSLQQISQGKMEWDKKTKNWYFKQGRKKFSIGLTAEGYRKIAILSILLENGYLDKNSIIFIDEIESTLHPKAILKFLEIIASLAEQGIQFFIASHSYFVIKKLFILSQKLDSLNIVTLSGNSDGWTMENLREGLPDNPIINESIDLYKEEVELAML